MSEYSTVLNVLSVHSNKPRLYKYAYYSSKSAVELLTKELAIEFSNRNITVNALSFGAVNTNMNKDLTEFERETAKNKVLLKKIFKAEEIANFAYDIINNFFKNLLLEVYL